VPVLWLCTVVFVECRGSLLSRLGGCAWQKRNLPASWIVGDHMHCVCAACSLPRVRLSKLLKLG
jgi:hypothetical protein